MATITVFESVTLDGVMQATPEPNPFTEALVGADKYVVSRRRDIRLEYPNSTLLAGDARDTVARLRAEQDGAITVLGSGELVRSLLQAGLVDELVLLQHPLVLGTGTRLFGADPLALDLRLAVPTTTGVIIGHYAVR